MFTANCHCNRIRLDTENSPKTITHCNCSICNRLGALWAYYSADKVSIHNHAETGQYRWGDKNLTFHFCQHCSCTTHYTTTKENGSRLVAINTRMAELSVTKDIPIRYFDGADTWQFID